MATTIVSEKILRWKGSTSDIVTLANECTRMVEQRTNARPVASVTATIDKVETLFDSVEEFCAASSDEFPSIQKIVVTIGEFGRNSPLSSEITFSRALTDPGVLIRTRGHDSAVVNWLNGELGKSLRKGRRRLQASLALLQVAVVLTVWVLGYLFWHYVGLPDVESDLLAYAIGILTVVVPAGIGFLLIYLVMWLVPGLELLHPGGTPRWNRYRRRTAVVAGVLVTGLVLPIAGSIIGDALKSDSDPAKPPAAGSSVPTTTVVASTTTATKGQ